MLLSALFQNTDRASRSNFGFSEFSLCNQHLRLGLVELSNQHSISNTHCEASGMINVFAGFLESGEFIVKEA